MRKPRKERISEAELNRRVSVRTVIRRRWSSGKRGTRRDMMPLKRVTVCVGIKFENATRKEVCKAIVPLMEVRLRDVLAQRKCTDRSQTYVQVMLPVTAKRSTSVPKVIAFGIRDVMRRNLTNSLEVHALSRYLPP